MTEQELITDIIDEITYSGSLPYQVPTREIKKIITNAESYFYDYWKDALEPRYLMLPVQIFSTSQFLSTRTITLPECVRFVHMCQETGGGGSIWGTMDRDFSDSKFIGAELSLTPQVGEGLVYRTIMMSFMDLTKSFTMQGMVQHDYNKNTRKLTILGHTPHRTLALKVMIKIGKEDLYSDEMFQRYTRAKAKLRLSEMLSSFEFQLPGGVKINYQNMAATAQKEFDKVLEDMKGENTADWMLFYH